MTFPSETEFSFSCHCNSCQKLVSGGRLFGYAVPLDSLECEGETSHYAYSGGSGKTITLHFCPKCSTQLYATPDSFAGMAVVRGNMLSDPQSFSPLKVLFSEEACLFDQKSS